MPCLEELRLGTGQLITEDWIDDLIDYLCELGYGGVVSVYGYVMKDLVPYVDLALNVGIPLKRFLEVHAGYVYASGNMWINGKVVLKDGDCITIGDIEDTAKTKISQAVGSGLDASVDIEAIKGSVAKLDTNLSGVEADIEQIHTDLGTLEDDQEATTTAIESLLARFKPSVEGLIWNVFKTGGVKLFGSNLVMSEDGRARVKIESSYYVYTSLIHKATGESVEIEALLNAGASLNPASWYEFDFTVMQNDELNLKIDKSSTITVIVYNIPNA